MDEAEFSKTLRGAIKALKNKPRLPLITHGEQLIIGDLHGDTASLMKILKRKHVAERLIDEDLRVVFLGDYVDRGPDSVGTLYRVCKLVRDYPGKVFSLRGNHESPPWISVSLSTFIDSIRYEFSNPDEVLRDVRELFRVMPYAAVIPGYAFLVHGHIPVKAPRLSQLMNLDEDDPRLVELLWNDPAETPISHPSLRGLGYCVGTKAVARFLMENNLKWVIRGHESYPQGYRVQGNTLTLHSLTLPCYNNPRAAYLKLPVEKTLNIVEYVWQLN